MHSWTLAIYFAAFNSHPWAWQEGKEEDWMHPSFCFQKSASTSKVALAEGSMQTVGNGWHNSVIIQTTQNKSRPVCPSVKDTPDPCSENRGLLCQRVPSPTTASLPPAAMEILAHLLCLLAWQYLPTQINLKASCLSWNVHNTTAFFSWWKGLRG